MIPLIAFIAATLSSVALGSVVRRAAPAAGAVVPPRPDRWHSSPTPSMGGIAIAGATLIGFVVVVAQPALNDGVAPWVSVLTASLAMFAVGIFDDRLQLSPLAKLVASLATGAFLVFALSGADPDDAFPSLYTLTATVWFGASVTR